MYIIRRIVNLFIVIFYTKYSISHIQRMIYDFLISTNCYIEKTQLIELIEKEITISSADINQVLIHMRLWVFFMKMYIVLFFIVFVINTYFFVFTALMLLLFLCLLGYRYYIDFHIYNLINTIIKPKLKYIRRETIID